MIEREDGKVTVTLGDGDVLIGTNCFAGHHPLVRLWFAPLPETWSHPLHTVVGTGPGPAVMPDDAGVVILFLNRESLVAHIEQLTKSLDKSFPLPAPGDVP